MAPHTRTDKSDMQCPSPLQTIACNEVLQVNINTTQCSLHCVNKNKHTNLMFDECDLEDMLNQILGNGISIAQCSYLTHHTHSDPEATVESRGVR